MFSLVLDGSPSIDVRSRNGLTRFGMDGSAPNPFEGALASIAGCAGVYAHKACVKAGVSPAGVQISLKPQATKGSTAGSTDIRRIGIIATFPEGFPQDLVPAVLASIDECPVKEMIRNGGGIEFSIVPVLAGQAVAA